MSLPSKPIQGALPGFLALLGVKNLGLNPDVLVGQVAPVLELGPWYLRGQQRYLSSVATLAAATVNGNFYPITGGGSLNGTVDLTVPENEWWYVQNFSVFSTQLSANDLLFLKLGMRRNLGGVAYNYFWQSPEFGAFAYHAGGALTGFAEPFWAPPGFQLGYFLNYTLAAQETLQFDLAYTPVQV